MQIISSVTLLSLVAAIAFAQNPAQLPACAIQCATSVPSTGCNGPTDIACLCKNPQFIAAQAQCITTACTNPSDLQQAQAFAQATCLSVSVTLSAPTATGSGTAPAGSASATSPASSASAAPKPTGAASTNFIPHVALLLGVAAGAAAL